MYNRSSVDDLSTADKIFSISKNTIFSIIMSSPSDFFMIPNFTDHIFDAVSEFCLQFKAKLPEMNHQDIAFLIKYIAHGMRSDSVKRKTNLFGSVSKVIDTLNTPNSQYISSKCPSLMNPIIDAIVGIMVKEPVSLDLLDYFCNTFLHLLKWYKDIVMDLIQNFLIANNVSDVIKSKIIQILDTVIQSSHSVQNKRNNFDSSTVSHHFLNLISILRSQNNIDL
ncbi:hypothetical protein RF11_01574 [Thelohanellus kitauei]|uniref:Uncharacterized protein n=1 Tax=Thelohanellus kitauei TaxID=669202 RepID=A0A0C2N610_THEKT|nr:hypothetical protein RF11_01574 [Thelohanellus kitauei]